MSRGDRHDLTERATVLANLAETITLDTIEDTIRMGMTRLGPLIGDAARLADLAAAYRAAATELRDTGAELLAEYAQTVPWQGEAAAEAAAVITTQGRKLGEDAEVLAAISALLSGHAERFAQARREHEELHQRFVDLRHRVSLVLPVLHLDPGGALAFTALVADALTDSAALLESVRADADAVAEGLRRVQDGGVAAARELATHR
ncbi:hypothetical protein N8J89_06980 [Crossiella sp. CA-258035]|uniref:hypothetical protein n=1 Tax=Crossiella sp. CA-258035 TaxID=2981138 RepID=UPI0024BC41B7|nr:hypothetical protein [Crossiella sp. CA-258035]WHT20799.1 hypothetical protein N8J89_06980 [Crossiella sp. CA-258035]